MRRIDHWTPKYVVSRTTQLINSTLHPDNPWMTRDMVKILETWLKPSDVGLEWGCGRSTVWFAKRITWITSVEHNPQWAGIVRAQLEAKELLSRVELRLEPDESTNDAPSQYAGVADGITDMSLNFCLVDGIVREQCALACIPKIAKGGMIIVDNVERYLPRVRKSSAPAARGIPDGYASDGWRMFADLVRDWRCIWTSDGVSDTACWVRTDEH